uniref:Uncharacterized protein n=1 Tax=Proboscia inermis TaxID=420281 RepID=A0A7S0CAZ9_9STRA
MTLSSMKLIKKSMRNFRNTHGCVCFFLLFMCLEFMSFKGSSNHLFQNEAGSPNSAVYFRSLLYFFVAFLYVVHVRTVTGIFIPPPLLVCHLEIFQLNQIRKRHPPVFRFFICVLLTT